MTTTSAPALACPSCGVRNRVPMSATGRPACASCHTALPWLVDATETTFRDALDSTLPVLVDVWAPWCGPCRLVAPAVEATATRLAGSLKVVKLNADEAPVASSSLGVQGIPTLVVFRGGREIARQVGALPAGALGDWVDRVLADPGGRG